MNVFMLIVEFTERNELFVCPSVCLSVSSRMCQCVGISPAQKVGGLDGGRGVSTCALYLEGRGRNQTQI